MLQLWKGPRARLMAHNEEFGVSQWESSSIRDTILLKFGARAMGKLRFSRFPGLCSKEMVRSLASAPLSAETLDTDEAMAIASIAWDLTRQWFWLDAIAETILLLVMMHMTVSLRNAGCASESDSDWDLDAQSCRSNAVPSGDLIMAWVLVIKLLLDEILPFLTALSTKAWRTYLLHDNHISGWSVLIEVIGLVCPYGNEDSISARIGSHVDRGAVDPHSSDLQGLLPLWTSSAANSKDAPVDWSFRKRHFHGFLRADTHDVCVGHAQ